MGQAALYSVVGAFAFLDLELLVEMLLGFALGGLKQLDERLSGAEVSGGKGELFGDKGVAAIFLDE